MILSSPTRGFSFALCSLGLMEIPSSCWKMKLKVDGNKNIVYAAEQVTRGQEELDEWQDKHHSFTKRLLWSRPCALTCLCFTRRDLWWRSASPRILHVSGFVRLCGARLWRACPCSPSGTSGRCWCVLSRRTVCSPRCLRAAPRRCTMRRASVGGWRRRAAAGCCAPPRPWLLRCSGRPPSRTPTRRPPVKRRGRRLGCCSWECWGCTDPTTSCCWGALCSCRWLFSVSTQRAKAEGLERISRVHMNIVG